MSSSIRCILTGRSGSGKSTLTVKLIAKNNRLIIFDVLDEYSRKIKGVKVATSLDKVKKLVKEHWKTGFKIAYVPPSGNEVQALHELSIFILKAQIPFKEGKEKRLITLVVEEMNTCFPISNLKAEYKGFPEICSRGRHYGINVIGVAQRSAEINTRFRGNCNFQIFFPPADARDLNTISQIIGREYFNTLKNLQTGQYLKLQDGKIQKFP